MLMYRRQRGSPKEREMKVMESGKAFEEDMSEQDLIVE